MWFLSANELLTRQSSFSSYVFVGICQLVQLCFLLHCAFGVS